MTRSLRLYAIIGAVVVVLLGAGLFVTLKIMADQVNGSIPQADLFGSSTGTPSAPGTSSTPGTPTPTPTPVGNDISGPINFLIIGVDTRTTIPGWVPHADAVMIMHITADHTHAYLTSLPRDLVVNIPAFAPANFSGTRSKLTHSMSFGSLVPGKSARSATQGFQLVAKTISAYTGITKWDGGALLTFQGLKTVVDRVGGIDIYVDQKTTSIHLAPNGAVRPPCGSCPHGFGGPQAVYTVGNHHLVGWQALDYARQRYIPGAAYSRDRHQRQVIRAIIAKVINTSYMTNPLSFMSLVKKLGSNIVFDGRGHQPLDFAYTLRNLRPSTMTLVGLPGSAVYSGGSYIGESLNGIEAPFFTALVQDKLAPFLAAHPSLVNTT
jgi:polyisoprenyl-teichoic acid--peptidoglycan teichoic acid transferase